MSEHRQGDSDWDDPERDEGDGEGDIREAQGEDPTSPMRGFDDLEELEEFDAENDETD